MKNKITIGRLNKISKIMNKIICKMNIINILKCDKRIRNDQSFPFIGFFIIVIVIVIDRNGMSLNLL